MKSLAKNYFLNLIYQMLIIILPLITAPYLSRVLGADRIGEYSFAQSIVSYFSLFAVLGTALYGQRCIAKCVALNMPKKQTFYEIVCIRVIGVAVALLSFYTLIFQFEINRLLYVIASIEILAVAFDIAWFFQGIEQFQNITLCSGIFKIIGVAGIFLFVRDKKDLEVYVFIFCSATLLGNIAQWFCVGKYLQDEDRYSLNLKRHIRPTLSLFVSQLAIQIYTVLDKTMIGIITKSDFENGYYEQSQKLIRSLTTVVTSIGAVMISRIAIVWNGDSEEKKKEIEKLMLISFRLVFSLGLPIAFGTIVVASRFVPFFYGGGYEPVVEMIQFLALIVPIIGCSNIIGLQLFVPSGREQLLTKSVMSGSAVNVVLNCILIPQKGALGAIYASILAELTVTFVQFYLAKEELPLKQIASLLLRYMILAGLMATVGVGISKMVNMGITGLFIIIIGCIISYLGLLVIIKDPILDGILKRNKE